MKTELNKYEDTDMGKVTLEKIREEIKELSPEERELLYLDLSEEINAVDPEIEKAWLEESKKRWKEIESGKVKTIPGHVVRAEARALING